MNYVNLKEIDIENVKVEDLYERLTKPKITIENYNLSEIKILFLAFIL